MRRHISAGLVATRKKRKFGELDATETLSTAVDASPAQFIESVVTEATGIQSDDEEDNLPETVMQPITCPVQPTRRRQIPLKDLFAYPADGDQVAVAHFEFYWKAGIRNLEAELAVYDANEEVTSTEQDDVAMDDTA